MKVRNKQLGRRARTIMIILFLFGIYNIPLNFNLTSDSDDYFIDNDSISDSILYNQDPKIVLGSKSVDSNQDKIADSLEAIITDIKANIPISAGNNALNNEFIEVIIDLNQKPTESILNTIKGYGGEIISVYDQLIYAIAAKIPVQNIRELSNEYEITLIEGNAQSKSHLDTSTIAIGARGSQEVWNASSPIKGNSSYSIAILDTGVDTSHPDMENVIYFEDFSDEGYGSGSTGYDYGHHGTHVASIAAGTGAADTNPAQINQTFTYHFPDALDVFYTGWFEIKENGANPDTIVNMTWDTSGGGAAKVSVVDQDYVLQKPFSTSTSSPIVNNIGKLSSGWYSIACAADTNPARLANYSTQVQQEYNYTHVNDSNGDPLFSGVAPNSNIVALKVLDDTGTGSSTWLLNALSWISSNGKSNTYNITVVSMSLGFDTVVPSVDTAVNNLVNDGFVCITSAGNDGTSATMGSPATADNCITVGATNDAFEIAYYSSNGGISNGKPDIVAPGGTLASSGSNSPSNTILAADSNNGESDSDLSDVCPDDYVGFQGTSMAAPHVAGMAQLAIDALIRRDGGDWTWSKANALLVKQYLLMATWEVNAGETFDGDSDATPQTPSLDRTGKDYVEGYGMTRMDAVIQAINSTPSNQFIDKTFYLDRRNDTHSGDYKVILFPFDVSAGDTYNITVEVPSTGDFDLIIYNSDNNPSDGSPIVNASSITAGLDQDENIEFQPTITGTFYWSVRAVEGYGECNVTMTRPVITNISPNVTKLIAHENFDAELECEFLDGTTSNPLVGKVISISTNLGTVNTSSDTTDAQGKIYIKLTGEEIIGQTQTATVSFSSTDPVFQSSYQIDFEANDAPLLNSPNDIYYGKNNATTIYINWTVTDSNFTSESNYTITLTGDDSDQFTGNWASDKKIGINVSGHSVGTYYYYVEIDDKYGGSDSDNVTVVVSESEYVVFITSNVSLAVAVEEYDVELIYSVMYQGYIPEVGATLNITTDLGILNVSYGVTDADGKIYVKLSSQQISQQSIYANITLNCTALDDLNHTHQFLFVQNDVPILNHISLIQFVIGATNKMIQWNVSDTYSSDTRYIITIEGTVNDTLTGTWSVDEPIEIDLTSLAVGTYNYTITVYDGYGGSATESVIVIISPVDNGFMDYIIPFTIALVFVIAIIVLIGRSKKKK